MLSYYVGIRYLNLQGSFASYCSLRWQYVIIYVQGFLGVSMLKYWFCYNKSPHTIVKFAGKKIFNKLVCFQRVCKNKVKILSKGSLGGI